MGDISGSREPSRSVSALSGVDPGRGTFTLRTNGAPPDDGILTGYPKIWLTVEDGEPTWVKLHIPSLVYVNGYPRLLGWPGDRVSVSTRRGRQSIRVTRARRGVSD